MGDLASPDCTRIGFDDIATGAFPAVVDFRVMIADSAYRAMREHAVTNTTIELCGVLIGEVYKDSQGPFLSITDIIRGEHADTGGAQVTFTHATWAHINAEKDGRFADRRIVGWYHTHPGFGVFLSEPDLFIHANFFNSSFQVAMVIDPLQDKKGLFVWRDGVPRTLPAFWIGTHLVHADERQEPVADAAPRSDVRIEQLTRKARVASRITWALALASSSLIFVGATVIARQERAKQRLAVELSRAIIATARKPDSSVVSCPGMVSEMEKRLREVAPLEGITIITKCDGGHLACEGEVISAYQRDLVAATARAIAGVKTVDVQSVIVSHRYPVAQGDNLVRIAERLCGDARVWPWIFESNRSRIPSPDTIGLGQVLVIP